MMKKSLGILLGLLTTLISATAQNSGANSGCATNPPDFVNLPYDKANAAVQAEEDLILGMRAKTICPEYITNLVEQLRHGHVSNDNKTLAFYFLGSLRARDTNSIEVLIQNIDFRATKLDPNLGPARWGFYPAQEALLKIGSQAVHPILAHLPGENVELRRHLMCDVLQRVERKDTALNQVREELANESDASKQANLKAALKEFGN